MKRLFSAILTLAMILSLLSLSALPARATWIACTDGNEHDWVIPDPSDWEHYYAPTCTDDGWYVEYCSKCGEYGEYYSIAALEHDWIVSMSFPATCTDDGFTIYVCANCGASEERDWTPATGHTWVEPMLGDPINYHDPTCEEDGWYTRYCYECGVSEDIYHPIPALGHDWQYDHTVAPTCTEEGYSVYSCAYCGAEEFRDYTDPAGHTVILCDNYNGTHNEVCEECNQYLATNVPHSYDAYGICGCGALGPNVVYAAKVTAEPADWSGDYILVYEDNNYYHAGYVFGGENTTQSVVQTGIKSQGIPFSAGMVSLTVAPMTGGYSIRINGGVNDGKYISGFSGSNTMYQTMTFSDVPVRNAISMGATGVVITSGTSVLRWDVSSRSFQYIHTDHSNALQPVQLFKLPCSHAGAAAVAAVAPTCTAAGNTAYYYCSACGKYFTDGTFATETTLAAVTIAATGHAYCYTDNGDGTHTVTCENCDFRDLQGHDFTNGACVCGAKVGSIEAAYPVLNESIDLVYAVSILPGATNPYMVFTYHGEEYTVTDYTVNASGQYCFAFTNISPQCLGDTVTAVLHSELNEEDYTDTVGSYSIRQYCVNMLNDTEDEALISLLSDLLTYGAAAQVYAGYHTDDLVTDGLTLTPTEFSGVNGGSSSFSGTADAAADWISAGLILGNNVAMRFTFAAESTENLTIGVSINGREEVFDAKDFTAGEPGTYYVDFWGVQADEFSDDVTAAFYQNGVQVGRTLNYSVNAYVAATSNSENNSLRALVRALYNYGASAAAYSNAQASN